MNLAAETHVDRSIDSRDAFLETNLARGPAARNVRP
jgi:dTDP-D-glucose 4,6-dehydratase